MTISGQDPKEYLAALNREIEKSRRPQRAWVETGLGISNLHSAVRLGDKIVARFMDYNDAHEYCNFLNNK